MCLCGWSFLFWIEGAWGGVVGGGGGVYSIRLRGRAGRLGPEEIPFYKGLIHGTVTLYALGSVCVCLHVYVCVCKTFHSQQKQ